jgi:hypothetical protein
MSYAAIWIVSFACDNVTQAFDVPGRQSRSKPRHFQPLSNFRAGF